MTLTVSTFHRQCIIDTGLNWSPRERYTVVQRIVSKPFTSYKNYLLICKIMYITSSKWKFHPSSHHKSRAITDVRLGSLTIFYWNCLLFQSVQLQDCTPPLPQIVPLESVCFFPYNQDRICTNFHEKSMLVLSLSQSNIRLMVD